MGPPRGLARSLPGSGPVLGRWPRFDLAPGSPALSLFSSLYSSPECSLISAAPCASRHEFATRQQRQLIARAHIRSSCVLLATCSPEIFLSAFASPSDFAFFLLELLRLPSLLARLPKQTLLLASDLLCSDVGALDGKLRLSCNFVLCSPICTFASRIARLLNCRQAQITCAPVCLPAHARPLSPSTPTCVPAGATCGAPSRLAKKSV